MKRLEEIKSRTAAATPGPWKYDNSEVVAFIQDEGEECVLIGCMDGFAVEDDYNFIAHARTDIPDLVEALELAIKALVDIETFAGHIETCKDYYSCEAGCEWSHIAKLWLEKIDKKLGEEK